MTNAWTTTGCPECGAGQGLSHSEVDCGRIRDLRTEVERLRAQLERVERVYQEGFDSVERDAYRRGLEDGRAENERLRAQVKQLREEIDGLRAALLTVGRSNCP